MLFLILPLQQPRLLLPKIGLWKLQSNKGGRWEIQASGLFHHQLWAEKENALVLAKVIPARSVSCARDSRGTDLLVMKRGCVNKLLIFLLHLMKVCFYKCWLNSGNDRRRVAGSTTKTGELKGSLHLWSVSVERKVAKKVLWCVAVTTAHLFPS